MMTLHRILPALSLALLAAGCDGLAGSGTTGELGQGTFLYECELPAGDAVPACNATDAVDLNKVTSDLGTDNQVPRGIAVNGRFGLHYFGDVTTHDHDRLNVSVEPAAADNVDERGGFSIRQAGHYAFLARDINMRTVADFTYIDAYDVKDLTIWKLEQEITKLDFTMGDPPELIAAVPIGDDGIGNVYLGGALPYEWTSSDETILMIDPANTIGEPIDGIELDDDEVRVSAVGEGTATLTIKAGTITRVLTVTVTPAMVTP